MGCARLGWQGCAGEPSPGSQTDLAGIPFAGQAAEHAAAVVHHTDEVAVSMIDG